MIVFQQLPGFRRGNNQKPVFDRRILSGRITVLQLFYTDTFEFPLPDSHRFPMSKYRMLRETLQADVTARDAFQFAIPHAATDEELLLVHHPDYLRAVCGGSLSEESIRQIGFPWSMELVERSRRSTGATLEAAAAALDAGCAANLAGGTHHAYADRGEGFCVFNDVCVAAKWLQREHGIRQILIVDCDVHQGNGTARIAEGDDSIFTFSIHSQTNYPFRKEKSDLDVGLARGTGDEGYLNALSSALESIAQRLVPEFVFYISGADPYEQDRLGRLSLTKRGLASRDRMVLEQWGRRGIPVALSMGGGYADCLEDIVKIHSNTLCIAGEFSKQAVS